MSNVASMQVGRLISVKDSKSIDVNDRWEIIKVNPKSLRVQHEDGRVINVKKENVIVRRTPNKTAPSTKTPTPARKRKPAAPAAAPAAKTDEPKETTTKKKSKKVGPKKSAKVTTKTRPLGQVVEVEGHDADSDYFVIIGYGKAPSTYKITLIGGKSDPILMADDALTTVDVSDWF